MTEPAPQGLQKLADDVRRWARAAAKWGAVLAVLCHLLPQHYRPVCDQIAALCGAGG